MMIKHLAGAHKPLTREPILKGESSVKLTSLTIELRLAAFVIANIIYFSTKQASLMDR